MTKRNASELAVVGASSDARFGERQSAHQRECARYARIIDDLNLDRGRAVALLSGTYARLEVGAPAPPLAPLAPVELRAFNEHVDREYAARKFWREADVVGHLFSDNGRLVLVRSPPPRARATTERRVTPPLSPPHATPPRARAQNMCFMTIEGIERMNVLERDVCSILDLGEFSTTRFVRSAGGKAPVMIDMQLRAGEAASGQMPAARDVEHLEANLEMSVVVGAASVVAMGAKVRARARVLVSFDAMRTAVRPPLPARAQVGPHQEEILRKMLRDGRLKRIIPLVPEVLKTAVAMELVSQTEADKLRAIAERSGWAHLYLCEKADGSWILSS